MTEIKCFLCRKKATINKGNKRRDLFSKELTIFFLVNRLLKVSSSLCTEFLEKQGNPTDWFDCCESCCDLIRDAEIVSKKIQKLRSRLKSRVEEIEKYVLKGFKTETVNSVKANDSYSDISEDVCRSIRNEVALRLRNKASQGVEEVHVNVKVKTEPVETEYEVDEDSEYYPPSPQIPEQTQSDADSDDQFTENDNDKNIHKCGNCGKEYKYLGSLQGHIRKCKSDEQEVISKKTQEDFNGDVCKVENESVGSPAYSNFDEEDMELPQGSDSNENNLNSVNSEDVKRERRTPRKPQLYDAHAYSSKSKKKKIQASQREDSLGDDISDAGYLQTMDIKDKNSQNKRKTTKKSKESFTCKCGKVYYYLSSVLSHKRGCKKCSDKQVLTRSRSLQETKNNSKWEINLKDSGPPKPIKLFAVIKNICLCSKNPSCWHRRALSRYKRSCLDTGKDLSELQNSLVAASEHVAAEEVGHYKCRLCRFGFKNKLTYSNHLIGYHDEYLTPPPKCECCKMIFIVKDELKLHIESIETCKTFYEALAVSESSKEKKVKRGRPTKRSEGENEESPTNPQDKSESDSDDSYVDGGLTSSGSSDDYELIDDDEVTSTLKNIPGGPIETDNGAANTSNTNVTIECQDTEGQNGATAVPTEESISSTSAEPTQKMRLFRTFRCLVCKDAFKKPDLLNSHILGVHKGQARPFVCHICEENFRTLSNLDDHYGQSHVGISKSTCPLIEGGVEEHKYRQLRQNKIPKLSLPSGLKKVEVDLRDPDFDPEQFEPAKRRERKSKRFITSEEYDPKYIYECKICDIKYNTENLYVRHSLFTHFEEIGVGEDDLIFHCDRCEKKYSNGGLLQAHKRSLHEGKTNPFECNVCREEFKIYKNYIDHCEDSHTKDGPVLCEICSVRFCDEQTKIIHLRKCHEDDVKPHRCSVCNAGFGSDMDLRYHRLKHFRKEEFMCEFCRVVFSTQHLLRKHQITSHLEEIGEDPLRCDQCEKIFTDKCGLQKHVKHVHIKEYTFKCTQCYRGYEYEESLKKHIQDRHVVGKRFLCSECPRRYWCNSELEKHQKAAHSGIIHKCDICHKSKIYASAKLLESHKKSHSMLYKCDICSKIYKEKKYLHVHLRGVHSISITYKDIKGYQADEEAVAEVTSRRSNVGSHHRTSKNKKKSQRKKSTQESAESGSELSNQQCDNVESTNSSAGVDSRPLSLIVPQPQMSTPMMTSRYSMDQLQPTSSNIFLSYPDNEHFMVPQPFPGPYSQQTSGPNSSSYFQRTMQGPSHHTHYSDPYQHFPHMSNRD